MSIYGPRNPEPMPRTDKMGQFQGPETEIMAKRCFIVTLHPALPTIRRGFNFPWTKTNISRQQFLCIKFYENVCYQYTSHASNLHPSFDTEETLLVIDKLSPNSSSSWTELALFSTFPPTNQQHNHPNRESIETSNVSSVGIPKLSSWPGSRLT